MSKEAMKLALEALEGLEALLLSMGLTHLIVYGDAEKTIPAMREALAEQPAPSELTTISEDECLLDVDESAWRRLVEKRGGCRCHLSPPCAACSEPVTEAELNDVGYTYEQPAQHEPSDLDVWKARALQAEAVVAKFMAPQPAQKEPVAWKLVPVEPTEDMWKAVNKLDDEMAAGSYDGKGCSIEQAWNCLLESAPATSLPAQRKPLTDANAQFNAAIDFAIEEGTGAAEFLRCWREGNTSEWPEFEAAHGIKENT